MTRQFRIQDLRPVSIEEGHEIVILSDHPQLALGSASPWGQVHTVTWYNSEVTYFEAEHGTGYHVTSFALSVMSTELLNQRHGVHAGLSSPWFGGDYDWSIVVTSFPKLFNTQQVVEGLSTMMHFLDRTPKQ